MKHPVLFSVAVISGIAGIILGICTGTVHNIFLGAMLLVAGRVLATADNINPENPLES